MLAGAVVAAVLAGFLVHTDDPACGRQQVMALALTTDGRVAATYGGSWWTFDAAGRPVEANDLIAPAPVEELRCAADGACYTVEASGVYRDGVRVLAWSAAEREAVSDQTACAGGALTFYDVVARSGGEVWAAVGSQGVLVLHPDGTRAQLALFDAAPLDLHPRDLGFAVFVPLGLALVWALTRARVRPLAVAGNLMIVGVALVFGPSQNIWALSHRPQIWNLWILIATAAAQLVWFAAAELSRNVPNP